MCEKTGGGLGEGLDGEGRGEEGRGEEGRRCLERRGEGMRAEDCIV